LGNGVDFFLFSRSLLLLLSSLFLVTPLYLFSQILSSFIA